MPNSIRAAGCRWENFQAFSSNNYNYAAALSVILAVLIGALSFLFYRVTSRRSA